MVKSKSIREKTARSVLAFGLSAVAMAAVGRDLLWTGGGSNVWNLDTSNTPWQNQADGSATYYATSDNVLFDDTLVPGISTVSVNGAGFGPGTLVFNIANSFTVTSSNPRMGFFWNPGVTSVVKNGSGTLTWTFSSGSTTTENIPVYINDGVLVCNATSQNPSGYVPRYGNYTRDYIVNDGGELRVTYRHCFGHGGNYTIATAGGGVVHVKKGGKFSLYVPDKSAQCLNSVWDLYLEGGTLDFQAKGYDGYTGLLLINHKLSVSGDTACVIAGNTNFDNAFISINKLTPTTFDIANVTGDAEPDLTMDCPITQQKDGTPQLVKQGAGTMLMRNRNTFFFADVVVKEGTLSLDSVNGETGASKGMNTVLGKMRESFGRKITIQDTGVLDVKYRNLFTSYGAGEDGNNLIDAEIIVKNGGTFAIRGSANLGPLTVEDGSIQFFDGVNYGWGALSVRGTMKIRGTMPFTLERHGTQCRQILYRSYATVFDVADVTGDANPDFVSELPFVLPDYADYSTDPTTGEKYPYGFVKTGVGTMALKANNNNSGNSLDMNGEVRVLEGTLQADGDISKSSAVVVSAGAYLAGTGTVNAVQIAAGGGFRGNASQRKPLKAKGNLTIGANPVIRIDNPDGVAEDKVKAKLVASEGAVVGAENLGDATVYLGDSVWDRSKYIIDCANGAITVKFAKGLMLTLE